LRAGEDPTGGIMDGCGDVRTLFPPVERRQHLEECAKDDVCMEWEYLLDDGPVVEGSGPDSLCRSGCDSREQYPSQWTGDGRRGRLPGKRALVARERLSAERLVHPHVHRS